MPATGKHRRKLKANLEAGNNTSGVDSAEVETPLYVGKRARRTSQLVPSPGKGKARAQQRDLDSGERVNALVLQGL